ncbi:MAG: class 1 fructose-bisphosphatase [Ignavibacteriales bacterium]|nr:MAG: class 1 fructose-bisphosphatase [Ignavibacteriaceae bacterium]MBW7874112.1 class 1 fructose-bisphosphatase [Ignavibacteria bacterium]MCZ2144210.1 class 1 fructose-bisphosphatase [Ignavibacteriales bacterium]OQY75257.1 MAG: fructose-bisphosphatase class I [Ignavibacteriales bacterium UTCHB3]MBV6444558.1 Fructose-1,6-bisphosphatase class 1 [Ignavibacteriaceae bacterium]
MSTTPFMTLERFIIEQERKHPEATGALSRILSDLSIAAKIVSREVNKAGLVEILGFTGSTNVHGESVKKLDIYAHDMLFKAMDHGGQLCVMASEEEEDIIHIPKHFRIGKYVMLFDPLDGSSNIDVNVSIGTIFSIYKRVSEGDGPGTLEDCLQRGLEQVAAGYVIYGSSTMLVYTVGEGVDGFTLDPSIGEFILSHPNMKIPEKGKIYSINEGNYKYWHPGLKKYIKWLQEEEKESGRPYSTRYIGSMVADVHRTLLYGGIFMYPADSRNPKGKLRLQYECNPMAFIIEAAGGKAIDGYKRILERVPTALHERCPIFIGSPFDVDKVAKFIADTDAELEKPI